MILSALILQAAAPQSAIDAERAFNAAAQARGQWTAFREYAAKDAVMFVPEPVNAHTWLRERDNPPKSVEWWPTASYVSCSGKVAVNTGGWIRPNGSVGYFSTVWVQQPDGSWKWKLDSGAQLKAARPRPANPKVVRAACGGKPEIDMGGCITDDGAGCIAANDQTLQAHWTRSAGKRTFSAAIWTGRGWKPVIDDEEVESAQ